MKDLNRFKGFAKIKEEKVNQSKDVWCYTRISSKQQSKKSLENQKNVSILYARKYGYNISNFFGGTYESAKGDFTRKEFSRLINEVKKARIKPFAILIYKMSRFSRTGGGGISLTDELIDKVGVHLVEVVSEIDTTTERGRLAIQEKLLQAKKENIERLEVTLPGMKQFVKDGGRLGNTPKGYDHYGPRVKDITKIREKQEIVISEDGKKLQQAWKWKVQGFPDFIIRQRLNELGYKISRQGLSSMWRNPFYCGISTHSMLDGEPVRGNWEQMVSEEDFLWVQKLLEGNHQGYQHNKNNPARPLVGTLFCPICGKKLTGYEVKKKKVHHYKCQKCNGVTINANTTPRSKGIGAHQMFEKLIKGYEIQDGFLDALKEYVKRDYKVFYKESNDRSRILEKDISKLEDQLKSLKKRYAFDEDFDKDVYSEFKTELEVKISKLTRELQNLSPEISNLNQYIDAGAQLSQKLLQYWQNGDIETKRRIQNTVFPHGLVIDTKKRRYLTKRVNVVFSAIRDVQRDSEGQKKDASDNLSDASYSVAGTGFEPATLRV